MCSISGFFNPYADYSANQAEYQQILKQMTPFSFTEVLMNVALPSRNAVVLPTPDCPLST